MFRSSARDLCLEEGIPLPHLHALTFNTDAHIYTVIHKYTYELAIVGSSTLFLVINPNPVAEMLDKPVCA